jgi:hypothetical protein
VVTDIDGLPADPTDISLQLLCSADGITATYAYNPGDIVRTGTGLYRLDLSTLTALGHYAYVWLTTGSNAGAGPMIGTFELYNPLAFNVVSTDDARQYLRLVDGSDVDSDDARLAAIIGSVTDGLTRLVGPLVPTTYTETLFAAGFLQLGRGPVRSITSLTALGSALTIAVADVEVLPGDVVQMTNQASINGWYTVVYSAGPSTIPNDVRTAALDWILHRWRQTQAHSSATYGDLIPDFAGPPNSVMNQVRHYLLTRSGV